MNADAEKRGWFRRMLPRSFSLRTLFAMTLIAGLGFAWWVDRQKMNERIARLEEAAGYVGNSAWAASQATGQPNSVGTGDQITAWAPSTQDGGEEWIELTYPQRLKPANIIIHEVCSGGCVYKVTGFDFWGKEYVLWEGIDPTPTAAGRGISNLAVTSNITTNRIKVYLDTTKATGWNELDAIGIVNDRGNTTWAKRARASSSYGANSINGMLAPSRGFTVTY